MTSNADKESAAPSRTWLYVVLVILFAIVSSVLIGGNKWLFQPRDDQITAESRLIVISGQDPSGARARRFATWNKSADAWNAAHPDRLRPQVSVVWLPTAANEQLAEMLRRARTPEHDADVYVLDAPWTRQFASAHYLRELTVDVDTDQFLRRPLATCRDGDTLYALPFNADAGLLYRHADLPAPKTLSQLVASAKAKSGGSAGSAVAAAFGGQFGRGEAYVVNVLEGIRARGGQVLDANGNLTLDGPGVQDALRQLSRDLADPTVIPPTADEFDEAATRQAFVDGRVAYMRNWPAFAPRNNEQKLREDVKVGPLPWPSVLGGQNLAIDDSTRYPRAATELIEWLTDEGSQTQLFLSGGFAPTRTRVYYDPEVSEKDRHPYALDLLRSIESAVPRPIVPNYPLFSQVFEDVMRRALGDEGTLTPTDIGEVEAAVDGKLFGNQAATAHG